MAWTGLTLTVDGRNALNQAQMNNRLCFKAIVIGDGNPPGNFGTQKSLVHPLYELTDLKVDMTDEGCALTADFPAVNDDYYFREIGVIVAAEDGDKLYVYDNCGDDAQYIVSTTGAERTQKRIRLYLTISDVADIAVSAPAILYVDYDEYEAGVDELRQNIDTKAPADKTFLSRGIFAGDIDTLRGQGKAGSYWVQPASHGTTSASGSIPFGPDNYYDLHVFAKNTGDATQMAVCFESNGRNDVRFRIHTNGKWYPWCTRLGMSDISAIGDGSVTGAITALNAPTFMQAGSRINIVSGDKLPTILGKIMKFFADLKAVAFSGSYSDLSDKPSIPAAVAVKGNAEVAYRTGNINLTPANIGLGNVANERQYSASNPQPSVAGSSGSCTGNAATATKAAQDWAGRSIVDTYLPKSDIGVNYNTSLSATKSIPNDVDTEVLTVRVGATGTYLLVGQVHFAGNKTGYRHVKFMSTDANGSFGGPRAAASNSGATVVQAISMSAPTLPANYTVRLYVRQNSGGPLNVTNAYMCAIRLK